MVFYGEDKWNIKAKAKGKGNDARDYLFTKIMLCFALIRNHAMRPFTLISRIKLLNA